MKALSIAIAGATIAALLAGSAPASKRLARVTCPVGALAFGTNPIAPATTAAIAREKPSARPQAVEAVVAKGDLRGRGGIVRHSCGAAAASRTVVVYITLRALLPSASLSERVSFVSRFRSGWRVWGIAH